VVDVFMDVGDIEPGGVVPAAGGGEGQSLARV
jgi:hypothetical protein